ncbi:glycoside hydrolase family 31 protein [Zasmidium cellare ATCC 36951]|uniref:alpha-glucosidase n=1 Tax=Zasmidium cellare ATCC 36951 TaxID=1080233 RepID=A0A6A6CIA3_ZASCE|nr:glycoside hydrolase family 31 protein [Zasmidium cellare ATCC 36951]KAF2166997.1 glycoside hydrolase family 31 protein [Zasmidium cellare ATCC 36951]
MVRLHALLSILPALAAAQMPQYGPAFPPTPARPVLPSSANYAPSVTPNVLDVTAPDSQKLCPGYKGSNVKESDGGVTADLTLAGPACNTYGNDIHDLLLQVEYQAKERLAVRIYPKTLVPSNQSLYLLSGDLTPLPGRESGCTKTSSDLVFKWSNDPSFQFQIARQSSGEVICDTYGSKIVFQDQFLELTTSMVPNYNIYGLAAYIHSFRLGNNFTQTFWNTYNLDNDQEIDVNGHDTHPVYLETRYANGSSTSHGVQFRLYFLSGSTPKKVISQYHTGIVGTPYLPAYWNLGFHQVRWGYQNWTNLQDVIDLYAEQNIQLEGIMNDLDYLKVNRIFSNNPGHYDIQQGKAFLDRLHANGQYYMPILDPNVYVPNPANATDAYEVYDRGAAEIQRFHEVLDFDGFWLDVNDANSFCTGSCGEEMLNQNPIHIPLPFPGDPDSAVAVDYRYPEGFEVTNATEAASASAAIASQSASYPTPAVTPTPVLGRTLPTPGVRNLNFPPYAINNFLPGHSLVKQAISPNATHNNGPFNSTEYELHNLYGHTSGNATYNSLKTLYGGKRAFFVSRSTFAGSGQFAGHWGGDTNSKWGNMYFGIAEALQFSIAGIPYFGVETCGFNGNADKDLCTRWMQLSAWYPFYRNHNNRNSIAQEAYRWADTAESTRRIMNIRYALLPYTYTLFHQANTMGETVLRALAWEFPAEASLAAVETQFMSGPAILVTPVLEPSVTTVQGVFPGVGSGTVWYNWYSYAKVDAQPGENKTLDAPLLHQPIHIRGGYIIPTQKPGNTTKASRTNPWSLIVAADPKGQAEGTLFLDDGISLVQQATKEADFRFANSTLYAKVSGKYEDKNPLANVTIAGLSTVPKAVCVSSGGQVQNSRGVKTRTDGNALYITDLESVTRGGAWNGNLVISLLSTKAGCGGSAGKVVI